VGSRILYRISERILSSSGDDVGEKEITELTVTKSQR
jgi:hypothetical protein